MKDIERWIIGGLLCTCIALAALSVFQNRVITQQRAEIIALVRAGAIR